MHAFYAKKRTEKKLTSGATIVAQSTPSENTPEAMEPISSGSGPNKATAAAIPAAVPTATAGAAAGGEAVAGVDVECGPVASGAAAGARAVGVCFDRSCSRERFDVLGDSRGSDVWMVGIGVGLATTTEVSSHDRSNIAVQWW